MSLQIVNKKWSQIGTKSGERFPIGLTSNVSWKIDGNRLIRRETVEAQQSVIIKNWRVTVPSTASGAFLPEPNGERQFVMAGPEGTLTVRIVGAKDARIELESSRDTRLGKGVLGAIPIHLVIGSGERTLLPGEKFVWEISLESWFK
jgi:hypothetical protein